MSNDTSSDAYEKVVDRLLASPRYAERMAMSWLDLARYADTHGYNNDGERIQWAWRDWVINAFDTGMPYDRFITEQLAGDLLEGATPQQQLATAFGRNHVITSEGGIIDEEYRVEYVADRVHTTATVFLGLSMQCARCHDHKFDPLTQREYYGFFSFFNNVPEGHASLQPGCGGGTGGRRRRRRSMRCCASGWRSKLPISTSGGKRRSVRLPSRWPAGKQRPARPAPPEPAVKPVASYPLDEGAGATVRDRQPTNGGHRNGALERGPRGEARRGKALEFDGQTYVELGERFRSSTTSRFRSASGFIRRRWSRAR